MSTFDDVVKRIADSGPQFNKFALVDFTAENINNSPSFVRMVLEEGFKLVDGDIELVSVTAATPEEAIKYEVMNSSNSNSASGKGKKVTRLSLAVSNLRLHKFTVRFNDQYYEPRVYTPFMEDGMLLLNDKWSIPRKVLLEKTYARVKEGNDKDGVSVSPIRVNILFNRRRSDRIQSYIETGAEGGYSHFIITSNLYSGQRRGRKICDRTILLYMFARFGVAATLKRFGIKKDDLAFVDTIAQDTKSFDYFAAASPDNRGPGDPGLFLKVRRTLLAEDQGRKFAVNVMYIVKHFIRDFDRTDLETIYRPDGYLWCVILGILNQGGESYGVAYEHALNNLRSVESFIDPLTKDRFTHFKEPINDIYDLLVATFVNIDALVVNTVSQDIYKCRLDVSNGILVNSFAQPIYKYNIYSIANKSKVTEKDVKRALSLSAGMFSKRVTHKKDDGDHYIAPPDIVGGNLLLAGGLTKIRMGGKAEQRLHPSMLVAESIGAFTGKNIGKSGFINPYIPVKDNDIHGSVDRPDYAAAIDKLSIYLPN